MYNVLTRAVRLLQMQQNQIALLLAELEQYVSLDTTSIGMDRFDGDMNDVTFSQNWNCYTNQAFTCTPLWLSAGFLWQSSGEDPTLESYLYQYPTNASIVGTDSVLVQHTGPSHEQQVNLALRNQLANNTNQDITNGNTFEMPGTSQIAHVNRQVRHTRRSGVTHRQDQAIYETSSRQQTHRCDHCGRVFSRRDSRTRHIRCVHKIY
ncbi:hypothetical protein EC973_002991 [Apophysomyces ossiformis]|uniref:C2H2-type domain-containing protein n=1 Tax=Apophysomyces ossiformis TaxID=679940 RepID=A0A8H7BY31_9FUNG|nr:hypothetical protein EC973_002991 [Apophysomyces ossiformis]